MNRRSNLISLAPDLQAFFSEQVSLVAKKQGLQLEDPVIKYLSALLERFSDSHNFMGLNAEGKKEFKRLSLLWAESLTATQTERYFLLQQLGDVALFTSGFFADRIPKTLVDLDFYMAMGEQAYEQAGHIRESIQSERALNVFFELARKFPNFTEILAEISDQALLSTDKDILKLYEKWLINGSQRIQRMLSEAGVIASKGTRGFPDGMS